METNGRKTAVVGGAWLRSTALAVALGILYAFPPAEVWFYPPCVFHTFTGWLCPGCGATRALHELLHGRFVEALALNPWMMVTLPLLAAYGIARVRIPVALAGALAVSGVAFSVLRNLLVP